MPRYEIIMICTDEPRLTLQVDAAGHLGLMLGGEPVTIPTFPSAPLPAALPQELPPLDTTAEPSPALAEDTSIAEAVEAEPTEAPAEDRPALYQPVMAALRALGEPSSLRAICEHMLAEGYAFTAQDPCDALRAFLRRAEAMGWVVRVQKPLSRQVFWSLPISPAKTKTRAG